MGQPAHRSFWNSESSPCSPATVITGLAERRPVETWLGQWRTFPAEVQQGEALPPCFSSHTINKCSFHDKYSAMVGGYSLHFCVLWDISLFKMAFRPSADVLSGVP